VTQPASDTLDDEKDKLWLTDAELIRRLGVPEKAAREAIRMLDAQRKGFPKKQKFGGIGATGRLGQAYFDRHYGGTLAPSQRKERA
jgi:hypothetical protein